VAAALAVSLAVPALASAYTRGFDVTNASSLTMRLTSVTGFQYGIGAPATDTQVMLADHQHFEVTFEFADSNVGTVTYSLYRSDNTYVGQLKVQLTVVAIDGNSISSCSISQGSQSQYQCAAGGNAITLLDPPGTSYHVPAAERQAQATLLNQLCSDQSPATCSFAVHSEVPVESPPHLVDGYLSNPDDPEPPEKTIEIHDTVGQSNSVDVSVTAGGSLFKAIELSVEATYSHDWTEEHEFVDSVAIKVPLGDQCEIDGTAPMLRDTGDFTLKLGNSTWQLPDVYFDTPNLSGTGRYGDVVHCTKLTAAQLKLLPPGVTDRPIVRGIYRIPADPVYRSVARPRLRVGISVPSPLLAGRPGQYRLTLSTVPQNRVVYQLRSARVRVRLGARDLGRGWLVRPLAGGRQNTRSFEFNVPAGTSGRVCLTAEARARNAVGAHATACAAVDRPTTANPS